MGDMKIPPYRDASTIVNNAPTNTPTGPNSATAASVKDSFSKVQSNATDLGAAKHYAEQLFGLAHTEGAQGQDLDALRAAATEALVGAHVSSDNIAAALASATGAFNQVLAQEDKAKAQGASQSQDDPASLQNSQQGGTSGTSGTSGL